MLKKGVIHHIHFVKVDPLAQLGKPGGKHRGDEVNVMAALGQVPAEFRAYYTASAICRINSDPDIH